MPLKIVTIGVYGFTEAGFFNALRQAGVDTFCDVRRRRGVRGSEYAFANRRRLEARLGQLGIRYLHLLEFAPSAAVRACQQNADRANRVARRQRTQLSPEFVAAYRSECLAAFRSQDFLKRLAPDTRVAALCCVERDPAACHRSLLAARLAEELGVEVVHLGPG